MLAPVTLNDVTDFLIFLKTSPLRPWRCSHRACDAKEGMWHVCLTVSLPASMLCLLVQSCDPECRQRGARDHKNKTTQHTSSPLCFLKLINSVFPVSGPVLGVVFLKIKKTQKWEGFLFLKVSFYKGYTCVPSDCRGSPLLEVALFSCNS